MKTILELTKEIQAEKPRSAWDQGVKEYALELIKNLLYNDNPADRKNLLNGADSWQEYSDGGCALIYDGDIAKRLCTPSELKKCKNGELPPNSNENWLEVQAHALHHAQKMIMRQVTK